MKLCGIDLYSGVPQQIIRKGNQFIRSKTLITKQGNITAKLKGDSVTIVGNGGEKALVADMNVLGHGQLTKKDMAQIFFDNFERIFDPKYDATPALREAARLEKMEKMA